MDDKIAKELLTWLANNHQNTSPFLSPINSPTVDLISLLDKIAKLRGIDKMDNGKEFDEIMEKLQNEHKSL